MGKTFSTNNLKIIASVAMFFDHFVTVFFPHNEPLSLAFRFFGRMAAPIFCFFIAQGFYYTSNLNKYIFRLLILAVISHFPYNYAFGLSMFRTSVVWPLTMGLIALAVVKNDKLNIALKLMIAVVCCVVTYRANWEFVAVLWVLAFGVFHGNFIRQIVSFCVIGIVFHLIPYFFVVEDLAFLQVISPQWFRLGFSHGTYPQWFQLGIFLAIPLLAMYSGKPGKKSVFMTWFFYVFYPAHLILLFILKQYTSMAEILEKLY